MGVGRSQAGCRSRTSRRRTRPRRPRRASHRPSPAPRPRSEVAPPRLPFRSNPVNETLLDLRPLDPVFEGLFGDASLRAQCFAQMLQVAFVGAITDRYVNFTSSQRAALDMLAQRHGVTLSPDAADRMLATMHALPPYPEVTDALSRLRARGHPLAALSNSPQNVEQARVMAPARPRSVVRSYGVGCPTGPRRITEPQRPCTRSPLSATTSVCPEPHITVSAVGSS